MAATAAAVQVHAEDEYAFRAACEYGQLDVVRELLALEGGRFIDGHTRARWWTWRGSCWR